jgi:hypothetical protein
MEKLPIVVSASRMTDMPAFYPEKIIEETELRKRKGFTIHTLVLWTKHIRSLFREPLFSYLCEQQKTGTQLYVQLTITGIGNAVFVSGNGNKKVYLEPGVPALYDSISCIEGLIDLVKNPQRIRLRVDPLVRIKDACSKVYSNYDKLAEIVQLLQVKKNRYYTYSFLEKDTYRKIDSRFANAGIEIVAPDFDERKILDSQFQKLALDFGVSITSCSVAGLPESACIDGHLLQQLHDLNWPLNTSLPRSRKLCGCTKSIDIGGWPPKICPSGCMYCYARPALNIRK